MNRPNKGNQVKDFAMRDLLNHDSKIIRIIVSEADFAQASISGFMRIQKNRYTVVGPNTGTQITEKFRYSWQFS